jgi:hypothetical protein
VHLKVNIPRLTFYEQSNAAFCHAIILISILHVKFEWLFFAADGHPAVVFVAVNCGLCIAPATQDKNGTDRPSCHVPDRQVLGTPSLPGPLPYLKPFGRI